NRQEHEERERFKAELLEQAREVVLLALRPSQWERLNTVTVLPIGQFTPQSHLSLSTLMFFSTPSPPGVNKPWDMVVSRFFSQAPPLSVPEELLPKAPLGETEYFQINCDWVEQPWLSRSLQGEDMPFNKNELDPFVPKYDTHTLSDGRVVSRVTVRVTPRRG